MLAKVRLARSFHTVWCRLRVDRGSDVWASGGGRPRLRTPQAFTIALEGYIVARAFTRRLTTRLIVHELP
jgi:hypothetical protein